MFTLASDTPGRVELLLGNEAIARGALEAGVKVATSYPGTPASEVIESLAKVAKEANIYVEWSVNEKIAAEVGAAASYAGLRSLTAFKHEGVNVALDFLAHLNIIGVRAGMVIVIGDDPQGWSSPSENDSRPLVRWLNVPLLEPSTPQEAKEMTRWAFELSEKLGIFCVVRSCTRVSHATGNVVLNKIPQIEAYPHFDTSKTFLFTPIVQKHADLLKKLDEVRGAFEVAPFNYYEGPDTPELLIISCGSSRLYSVEAIECLELFNKVGILHLGTTWPLPTKLLRKYLSQTSRILMVEEVDPFLETNIKALMGDIGWIAQAPAIYGKGTGHIKPCGELTPDAVIEALTSLMKVEYEPRAVHYHHQAQQAVRDLVISREVVWCPGCPHRPIFWAIKNSLRLDGRDGFVTGDIGCYGLDRRGAGGYLITKVAAAMGSGAGIASGLGKLQQFGFSQPIVTVCGDSTFYHAAIPALINAKYNQSNITMVILDNRATAMTGFQPHPGVGFNAVGEETPVVDIEAICKSLGIPVEIMDPFELDQVTYRLVELIQEEGLKVVIMRRPCALLRPKEEKPPFRLWVDAQKCLGEECGCNRYCVRVFKCPGLAWDRVNRKAQIDEAICVGCGVCASICPTSAIVKEPTDANIETV